MKFVIIGLSITSSWGNGHATTYRALIKELTKLEHDVLFLERDVPYYAANRDMPDPDFCSLGLYASEDELKRQYTEEIEKADVVIVGSYVKNGVEVGNWVTQQAKGVTAFYDIDTPVTLAKLQRQDYEYINPKLISKYDIYLSFTGGPILEHLENYYHSPKAKPLYCSVDPDLYYQESLEKKWLLGYLGTYSDDRQPTLDDFLLKPAEVLKEDQFVVAGPQYPSSISWSANITRIEHLPPAAHRNFYNSQKFTLNVTREDMIRAGYAPSVRLFEAAACGVPLISDYWEGLETLFQPDSEILIARSSSDVQRYLTEISEKERLEIGLKAQKKVLQKHTSKARAEQLVSYVKEVFELSEKNE